jgi:hypothetical protein
MGGNHLMDETDQLLPADISADTRTLIKAITVVQDLEQRLPLIDTIEEVERLRIQTVTVLRFARETQKQTGVASEWRAVAQELERWAARVAIMCQRRVGQLLKTVGLSQGGRPQKTGRLSRPVSEVPVPPPVTLESLGLTKDYAATAAVLARVGKKDLEVKIDQQIEQEGEIKKKKLIAQIKAEAKAKGESIDDKTAASRARHRRYQEKKRSERNREQAAKSPRVRESPSDRFKRYWTNEKKLLYQFFETSDLEKVGEYWWREFHAYRLQEEKVLSDLRQERERRKGLAELTKNP